MPRSLPGRSRGSWIGRLLSSRRRHPLAAIAVLVAVLFTAGGAYAALAPSTTQNVQAASSTQIEEGRQLFAVGCSSCHGLNGEGQVQEDGEVLGPSLIGVGAASVDFQVGTGRMPLAAPSAQAERKPPSYNQRQIDSLSAFVASLAPGPAEPDEEWLDTSQGNVARGGELFRTNCSQCHNTTGQGGALTMGQFAPNLTGVEPKHIYEAMITGPQAMPVFNDNTVTPEDKRDIIAFLESVQNEPDPGGLAIGRAGPVAEGLWAWLVGIGLLIGMATWIVTRSSKA
ncbi:cytochrome bc1 complex diheme cytochrome c subunit [Jiangella anatolica]|uniref:cytochrome bc1 complex diheme cytochrome c subunit n=1 Tax=Jiangella anatolica TaxID=2670374 RepID=UPI001F2FF7D6|nr:c-type cytochrome [Jiangella anatolica]